MVWQPAHLEVLVPDAWSLTQTHTLYVFVHQLQSASSKTDLKHVFVLPNMEFAKDGETVQKGGAEQGNRAEMTAVPGVKDCN